VTGGRGVVLWEATMLLLDAPFICIGALSLWRVPLLLRDCCETSCRTAGRRP
jgi:multisubunit Na+/H+ antiporter MnhG subunit